MARGFIAIVSLVLLACVSAQAEAAPKSVQVYCVIQEEGRHHLTQKEFTLEDLHDQVLFDVDGLQYLALYVADWDFRVKDTAALQITIVDKQTHDEVQARAFWPEDQALKQVRIDSHPGDPANRSARRFFYCDSQPAP